MYTEVSINEDVKSILKFDEENVENILKKVKSNTDKFSKKDVEKIEEALDILQNSSEEFNVCAYIDEIELDEYQIDDAYDDIHLSDKDEHYEEGYEDALERVNNYKDHILQCHCVLMQKIEHLAFNYGKQEELTKSDILEIRELLNHRFNKND